MARLDICNSPLWMLQMHAVMHFVLMNVQGVSQCRHRPQTECQVVHIDVQVDAVLKAPALSEQQLEGSSAKTWLHHDDKVRMSNCFKRVCFLIRSSSAACLPACKIAAQRLAPSAAILVLVGKLRSRDLCTGIFG